jgi:hypothetical protein
MEEGAMRPSLAARLRQLEVAIVPEGREVVLRVQCASADEPPVDIFVYRYRLTAGRWAREEEEDER